MLDTIGTILLTIVLPVFALIGLGALLERAFRLDVPTLSKLNFFVFVPSLVFISLLHSPFAFSALGELALLATLHVLLLWGCCSLLFAASPLRESKATLTLGTLFYNAGNYGLPLAALAFPDVGVNAMAVVMVTQNFLNFTLGVWLLEKDKRSGWGDALKGLAKVPVIWAVALALGCRSVGFEPPEPLARPLEYLAGGLIPVALLTLGVQLAQPRPGSNRTALGALCAVRLVLSPMLAAALVALFAATGNRVIGGEVFIVAAGLPVAVNVFILSVEYRRSPGLASQMVFWTTLLSAATVSVILAFLQS
ncbi:MAG: AEC family transporter [Opitutales bacterium]